MSFLKQKSKLHQCEREERNDFLKLKGPDRSDVFVPSSYAPLLEALDGTQSLGQIWRQIVIPDPKLSLKDLFYLLSELDRIGCLQDFRWEEQEMGSPRFKFRVSKIWLENAFSLMTLSAPALKSLLRPLVWFLSLGSILLFLLHSMDGKLETTFSLNGVFLPVGFFLSFWLVSSLLKMGQSLLQGITLWLGTGERIRSSLEISLLHLRLRIHEEPVSLWSSNRGFLIVLYLGWALMPLVLGFSLASFDPHNAFWWASVGTLLTLLEFNPYRDSLCTRLLSRLIGPEDFHALFLPYLYSSSFFSVFYRPRSLPRERQMVVYSSVCVAWSLFFLNHTISILGDNLARLAQALGQSPTMRSLDISAFALVPIVLSLDILWDLLSQLLGNTKFPLLSKFYSVFSGRSLNASQSSASEEVANQVASLDLFRGINPELIREIVKQSKPVNVSSGRRVLVQGTTNDELLILLEGQLRIEKRDDYGSKVVLAYVDPLYVLGETAAILGLPRQADAITQGPTRMLVVSGKRVQELLKAHPGALELFMERITLSHALASSKTFRKLPQEVVKIVSQQGVLEKLPAHKPLLKEGDSGRDFYMLVKGQLEVTRLGKHIAKIEAGDTFGEISLMREVQRTASVTSLDQECQVFRLAAMPFLDILENHPELALAIEAQADFRSETYS